LESQNNRIFSLDNFEINSNEKKKIEYKNSFNNNINKTNSSSTRMGNNIQYEDVKITNWIKYKTYTDYHGMNENIFYNITKYLNFVDLTRSSMVCKSWNYFYKSTINSYNYFSKIDTSKISSVKEFTELIKKGKNLGIIKKLNEIVKKDFGGEKHPENLFNKVIVIMNLANVDDLKYKGTLLEGFKIKPKKDYLNNLISNESIINICSSSRYTMKEFSLRGCYKLTNRITNGIANCCFLEKLDLSNNK
jgi:hypothetical protein